MGEVVTKRPHEWSPSFRKLLQIVIKQTAHEPREWDWLDVVNQNDLRLPGAGSPGLFIGFDGEAPSEMGWDNDKGDEDTYFRLAHANIEYRKPRRHTFHYLTTSGDVLCEDNNYDDKIYTERILTSDEIDALAAQIVTAG